MPPYSFTPSQGGGVTVGSAYAGFPGLPETVCTWART